MMIYKTKVLMICNSYGIDDIQGFALIFSKLYSIIITKEVIVCTMIQSSGIH